MPKITIKNPSVTRDVSAYYDFQQSKYTFTETYDPHRGRTKTATIDLYGVDTSFVIPLEDNIINIYRDTAGTDLVFGGVIVQIDRKVVGYDGVNWQVNYSLQCAGYDPQTLNYHEVVNYYQTNIKSGQVIKDLLGTYAPWVNTTNVQVSSSPTIAQIGFTRKQLSLVIQQIIEATDWVFYIDDTGAAYYDSSINLPLNWGLTEGTKINRFPEFDDDTLKVGPNVQESANDITLIGGAAKGPKYVETFQFNGQDGQIALADIPFGLDSVIQFLDNMDQAAINTAKWFISDPGTKLTESLGRLQVNSAVSNTGVIVSKTLFSRTDNVEFRVAEFEIYSFASGKATIGLHSGAQNNTVTNFIHALEFDQASGSLKTREGSTLTTFGSIPIGVGIYSIRIRVKATGGAIYFIQGGRTATAKEYGELGSKTWTKVVETGADTTAFMGIAMRFDTAIGCTAIRAKVSTDINVTVTLLSGGKLGTRAAVGSDTSLFCGVQGALDFETDCYIDVANSNPTLNFFTDDLPLGNVRITYWGQDDTIRERVYSSASKTSILARSALTGDDGSRTTTAQKVTDITSSQDARDQIISWLNNLSQYRGGFTTNSWRLGRLIPVGEKPRAGKLLAVTLPTTWGFTFSEVVTSVNGTDLGTDDVQYDVQFGEGNISFDRLLRKIKDKALISIIDDQLAAVDADSEDMSTAGTPRISSPDFTSASFDGTGVAVAWGAVAGASNYEVRDNIFKGQGAGGSLVYQKSASTSYSISAANIKTVHKKRSFTFYVWAITAGGQYSKYPLIVTVDNPAPVPQPISDIVNPNGIAISVRFVPEVESDILISTGRRVQIDATDATMTHIAIDTTVAKTVASYDFSGAANVTYYVRYGLKDDYTDSLGDILWSGVRTVQAGAADFSGTVQFLSNTAPDNAPTGLGQSTGSIGTNYLTTLSWSYTQGANIATNFGVIVKLGGGTPNPASDAYLIVDSTVRSFKVFLEPNVYSFAVFAIAVTKGGQTRNSTLSSVTSVVIATDSQYDTAVGGGVNKLGGLGEVVVHNNLYPSVNNTYTCGKSGSQWLEVRSLNIYRNGTEIGSVFSTPSSVASTLTAYALLAGNTYSGLHNFASAQIEPRVYGSLASFKSGITVGCFAFYADSGAMHVGYFDGSTYFGVDMPVV